MFSMKWDIFVCRSIKKEQFWTKKPKCKNAFWHLYLFSYFCYMYKVGIWVMPLVFKTHKALQWSFSFKYSIIFNMGALHYVYWMNSLQLNVFFYYSSHCQYWEAWIIMIQKNVFKTTRKVLSGVYFPGPFFPPCFGEFQRDWHKHFDLVLKGVSPMPAMLKLRDV